MGCSATAFHPQSEPIVDRCSFKRASGDPRALVARGSSSTNSRPPSVRSGTYPLAASITSRVSPSRSFALLGLAWGAREPRIEAERPYVNARSTLARADDFAYDHSVTLLTWVTSAPR